jgi:putative PIN family toxin of toxin-antitoxin system
VRAVLDTNVIVSGIFFGGLPRAVLEAWSERQFELLLSPSIYDEYLRTCARLASSHPGLEYQRILTTIVGRGVLVPDSSFDGQITADPDDDKFLLCAHDNRGIVVSGDRHLLEASGWKDTTVVTPRDFLQRLGERSPDSA